MEVKNNLVAKTDENKKITFREFVLKKTENLMQPQEQQRFLSSIVSVMNNNPSIAECDKSSIVNCALLGEALKLPPSPQLGYFYMVPFNNTEKNCKEAQFQLGYKGYIQLAIRSGQYRNINVVAIKEGELKSYNPLTEELQITFIEDDEIREKTATIGYYAMLETISGFRKSIYWSKKKMLAHADKYSQSFHLHETTTKKGYKIVSYEEYTKNKEKYEKSPLYSSFWYKDFDGMAFKTMLRQLISKWGIMSVEIQKAYDNDMGIIRDDGSVDFSDNPQSKDNKTNNPIIETQAEEVEKQVKKDEQYSEEF